MQTKENGTSFVFGENETKNLLVSFIGYLGQETIQIMNVQKQNMNWLN